jgi:AcrR family transcriptional regulator
LVCKRLNYLLPERLLGRRQLLKLPAQPQCFRGERGIGLIDCRRERVDEQKALSVMRELVDSGQLTDPDSARGKLLQVAAHLFRHKGYERTTVRDLAGAVGIQSGSIFHHFKSKDEILRAVMEETIRYNTALMRAAIAETGDVRERVLALIRCELQSIMGGSGEAMAVLVYEWRSLSEEGQAQVLALRDIYEDIWLQVLGQAKSAGFIRGDVFITRRFLTGALSWTTTWFRAGGSMSLDQLAEEALILVLEGK